MRQTIFRIITTGGSLSQDTFVIAAQQPANVKSDCLMLINQRDRSRRTVHATRLLPAFATGHGHGPHKACRKCGHVEGVLDEPLPCPHRGHPPCVSLGEPRSTKSEYRTPKQIQGPKE
jgi:hypothetical protein